MVIQVNDRVKRRRLLEWSMALLLGSSARGHPLAAPATMMNAAPATAARSGGEVTLFLSGDVMTGRGIDQVLPHPSDPRLYEPYVKSAREYVALAERAHGPLTKPVGYAYIWGDALAALDRLRPDARIVNLETSVTTADAPWPHKGIHYRMHPANVGCLTAARLDCCVLANNHVMDWGRPGLAETLSTLHAAGLRTAGAGRDLAQAKAPAAIDVGSKARVLVFAYGMPESGVPAAWAATSTRAGVNLLPDLSSHSADAIAHDVQAHKRSGDVVVLSLHWGGNWGYDIGAAEQAFARRMIDTAGVDIVHGHSSHHPKGIEVHRERLILYGCGDLLDDYEGISGYEAFRADLGFLYLATVDAATGALTRLILVPKRTRRLRLERAEPAEAAWLAAMLNREGRALGTRVTPEHDGTLHLEWR